MPIMWNNNSHDPWFHDGCMSVCEGKTALAVRLARYYGAACLNIDSVVQEALSSGTCPASKQARELFRAAMESVPGPEKHIGKYICFCYLPFPSLPFICKCSKLQLK